MLGVWSVAAGLLSFAAHAKLPQDAPPLAPVDPTYDVVEVDTAQELADACWDLVSNQAIVISPGTYDLASVSFPNGLDGRLTVGHFGVPPENPPQGVGAAWARLRCCARSPMSPHRHRSHA